MAVSVGDTNDRSVSLCDLTSGQLGEGGAHLHSPPMHALGRKPGLALMLVLIFPSFKAPHKVNEHYSCQVAEEDAEGLNSFLKSNRSPPKHHSCSPGCKSFMQFFTTPVERISCPFIVKGNKMHSRPISRYVCMYNMYPCTYYIYNTPSIPCRVVFLLLASLSAEEINK